MISITDNIKLQAIKIEDQPKLIQLLELIYPPAYKHLWVNENCGFYLNKFYSKKNLKLELKDPNADYFFVIYNSHLVGIFRLIHNNEFKDFPKKQATYINRIYLDKMAQGKGVAQELFKWAERKAKLNGSLLMWLKVMDSQKQALRFYKKQDYKFGSPTRLDFELLHPNLRGMFTMYKSLI